MARRAFGWTPALLAVAAIVGCGSSNGSDFNSGSKGGSGSGSAAGSSGGSSTGLSGTFSGTIGGTSSDGGLIGVVADPNCPNGGNTTISGTVYDPSLQDPLYNITVFIPIAGTPLPTLSSGASCAACADYYPTNVVAAAGTDATGHFTITKAANGPALPVGQNIPIVVQTGKWRMEYTIGNVTACQDNAQPDKTLRMPRNSSEGNLPDFAISTGGADSLECLPLRIGVDASEYTAGNTGTGHIHIFQGHNGATTNPAAPASFRSLWDSTADLTKNDVVLLSCEGEETANKTVANQQSLSDYASAGGRVFASHFHYAWFNTGPFGANNLATWTTGTQTLNDKVSFPGQVVTTLNTAAGGTFPEGVALDSWLGVVNALTNGLLPIWYSRHNADVRVANAASQPWIVLDSTSTMAAGATQYFSFDTPIGSVGAEKCGRVVYSDLHVSGGPGTNQPGVAPDYPGAAMNMGGVVPSGCAMHPLTPQEKALEFMIFDLSSCLIPVGSPPPQPPAPK